MPHRLENIWERAVAVVEPWLDEALDQAASIVRGGPMPPFHKRLSTEEQLRRFLSPSPLDLARLAQHTPEEQVAYYMAMSKLLRNRTGLFGPMPDLPEEERDDADTLPPIGP